MDQDLQFFSGKPGLVPFLQNQQPPYRRKQKDTDQCLCYSYDWKHFSIKSSPLREQLKRLISKIEVDKDGNVDIYMRLIGELGLDENVLIQDTGSNIGGDETTPENIVPNCNNRT